MQGQRRGETLDLTEQLTTERCGVCQVMFAFPTSMQKRARANHAVEFFCPNGHQLHYLGKTTSELAADQQRARAEQAEQELAYTRRRRDEEAAEAQRQRRIADKATRSARAIRAHRDRVLRLLGLGLCPVGKCGLDLGPAVHEHVEAAHPKFHQHYLSGADA